MKELYGLLGLYLYKITLPFLRLYFKNSRRVYVAIVYDKKVMLIKNWLSRDEWRLPGGGVKGGESDYECALREVKEELRIVIQPDKLVLLSEGIVTSDKLGYKYVIYAYKSDAYPKISPYGWEVLDARFFEQIPDKTALETANALEQLRGNKMLY